MGFPTDGMTFNSGQTMNTPSSVQMTNGMANNWHNQPQMGPDMSNINLQDIFGGTEWNPMLMNPDFR